MPASAVPALNPRQLWSCNPSERSSDKITQRIPPPEFQKVIE